MSHPAVVVVVVVVVVDLSFPSSQSPGTSFVSGLNLYLGLASKLLTRILDLHLGLGSGPPDQNPGSAPWL